MGKEAPPGKCPRPWVCLIDQKLGNRSRYPNPKDKDRTHRWYRHQNLLATVMIFGVSGNARLFLYIVRQPI